MTQQHINLGNQSDGKDGDTNRVAWAKAEANFIELYGGALSANTFKNKLINGRFDFWQRGTSLSAYQAATKYLADRWAHTANGTTLAPSQQAFAPGQAAVPGGPAYFHRCVVASSAGAGSYALLIHKIEGLEQFSGNTLTLSFWAKADATKAMGVEIQKNYGTGGSTTDDAAATTAFSLTSQWQRFTFTFAVPSNAGKIISGGNDCLVINFWFDCGSYYTPRGTIGQQSGAFDIANVQLEYGSAATSFDTRPAAMELTLCQRYFQKSVHPATVPGTAYAAGNGPYVTWFTPTSGGNATIQASLPTTMRTAPAVTPYDAAGTAGRCSYYTGSWNDAGNISAINAGVQRVAFVFRGLAAAIAAIDLQFALDAEL